MKQIWKNSYSSDINTMLEGLQTYYQQTGVTPGVPNQLGKTADPYVSGTAYPNIALGNYDVPEGWPGKVVKHGKGEVPGPPVWFEEEGVQEAVAGVGYQSDNQRESEIFFYHTDHLQSTTYLTDSVGNISQFVWYAPYGEALVDEHVGSYENPYKFSGKELDENTGLYDHGARHREPALGVWYGVDALFEKYPEISPYSYCGGNPVRFVDMDGREFDKENEVIAKKIEKAINQRIQYFYAMEYWDDEIVHRVNELNQSNDDVCDMRNDENAYYQYKSSDDPDNPCGEGNPNISGIGKKIVYIYVDDNMGSKLHETRHGGDVARGILNEENYGVSHEISAYKAQFSYDGELKFFDDPPQSVMMQRLQKGQPVNQNVVSKIGDITVDFVKSICTIENNVPYKLYPPNNVSADKFFDR